MDMAVGMEAIGDMEAVDEAMDMDMVDTKKATVMEDTIRAMAMDMAMEDTTKATDMEATTKAMDMGAAIIVEERAMAMEAIMAEELRSYNLSGLNNEHYAVITHFKYQ